MKKINSNIDRDKKVNEKLKNDGWIVLRFWEHEVKKNPDTLVKKIAEMLKDSTTHKSE
jgi:DNA mismatch endonuclease (patch repair protein)